ncbi:MAG: biopolymer transporter ExbD [Nonlabens sp.]|jgi:biopolymer transport protein ExbD|uniref:ExbD/TolR family protein n=1 Tax=Nonlabens sp. TaxID=1888209 RepID=UPI003219A6DF
MNLRGRNKVSPEFSMSSMTDIVFLLLVFFLLTSPSITPEALDLMLPSAGGKTQKQGKVTVSISKDGVFYVDATQATEEDLESRILSVLEGKDKPTIMLRSDENAAVGHTVKVMDIANRNKVQVVLAVKNN